MLLVNEAVRVVAGDCREVMPRLTAEGLRFDAVVTDPPYGLRFMGRGWDDPRENAAFDPATWRLALDLLKPGGHLVAFGGPRVYHHLALAIEQAGFEVRDCLMWLFGSGFPKSLDVSKALDKAAGAEREVMALHRRPDKRGGNYHGASESRPQIEWAETAPASEAARQWNGWGTALKPAYEPIILARRPLAGSVAANVLAQGCGGLNIDACRVGDGKPVPTSFSNSRRGYGGYTRERTTGPGSDPNRGRHPANLLLDPEAAAALDAQSGELSSGCWSGRRHQPKTRTAYGAFASGREQPRPGDSGGASRFFYTGKACVAERYGSAHPTVKPLDLMRWLVRLVCPPGGSVLDPFAGTGTTGQAAWLEGFRAVLIEREAEYLADIEQRLALCAPLLAGPRGEAA